MNHIKTFEGRTYKNLYKYIPHLAKKFGAGEIMLYEENEKKYLVLTFYSGLSKERYIYLYENFKDMNFRIVDPNKYKPVIRFEVDNVPNSFFEQLEVEMNASMYNL